jgi:hypothetical protein
MGFSSSDDVQYQNHFFSTIQDEQPSPTRRFADSPTRRFADSPTRRKNSFDPFSSFRTDDDSEERIDVR